MKAWPKGELVLELGVTTKKVRMRFRPGISMCLTRISLVSSSTAMLERMEHPSPALIDTGNGMK